MSRNLTNLTDNSTAERLKFDRLKAALDGPFARLVGKRVLSPAHATREMDGRLIPFVLATVHDSERRPVAGMLLELRDDDGNVIDTTRTSSGGLGILRFPARKPRPVRKAEERSRVTVLADGGEVTGTVTLLDGSDASPVQKVAIPPSLQVANAAFLIREPAGAATVQLPPGDDPITRLPTDISEDACDKLLRGLRPEGPLDPSNLFTRPDPLLSPPAGVKTIAGKRLPLLRRLDIIRFGEDDKRFLVRLRQEWVLLAYTLGEMADVTALDPGAVLQTADQLVSETSSAARDVLDSSSSKLTQTLQDVLSNRGTVDSVVSTVQNTSASTSAFAGGIVGGLFGGIGGIFGGFGVASTDVSTHLDLRVSTNVNTSLLVNRAVQQASTLINEAVSKTRAVAEGVGRSATSVVNHLAPLVTQVANALHWRVYEVYAVCTNVDAVHQILELPLFVNRPFEEPEIVKFGPDDVRAYRPFFEPALLDRTLAKGFDALTKLAGLPPLMEATVQVTVDSDFRNLGVPTGALVAMSMNGVVDEITVPRGNGRTGLLRFNFTTPVKRGAPLTVTLDIGAAAFLAALSTGSGAVRRVEVWVDRPLSGPGFILDNPPTVFQVPIGADPPGADALLTHINHHLHYYYGVLAAAAIAFPSLREDAPQLANIDADFWRLPLIGLEGTVALLIDEATTSVDAATLLDDPGAGTLVQILAPGSYGEVLTGLLNIPLDAIHPLLKEVGTVSPFGAFPNLPTGDTTSVVPDILPLP